MTTIRPAAVAGMFYTDDPTELSSQVQHFMHEARPARHTPKAIIAPHAGYMYSGPVAGSAYASLTPLAQQIERVVLLGPAHRVYVTGIAASSAATFATPLGEVPLDQDTLHDLTRELDYVNYNDEAHREEHSLEVQLPFLQSVLGEFRLLPLLVGDAQPIVVEQLLERLWGGPETLIVISSDLSHYHDYATAQRLDSFTTDRIAHLDPAALDSENACGQVPVRGLLRSAVRHHLQCEVLDVRNSGDTAGGHGRVVGYGAYAFSPAQPEYTFTVQQRQELTDLARSAIEYGLKHDTAPAIDLEQWPAELREQRASFVTLNINDELRGCIGSLEAHRPLPQDIADNAFAAAFRDPRFNPVSEQEVAQLEIHLSVLSKPEHVPFNSEQDLLQQIRPGVDGLILQDGEHRGTFLPSVWESLPERHSFLRRLKSKAGLSPDYWSNSVQVSRYTTESW